MAQVPKTVAGKPCAGCGGVNGVVAPTPDMRVSGRAAAVRSPGGSDADRVIAAVRDGLDALRLEVQACARAQQKALSDEISTLREELLNVATEAHPEIQDLADDVEEEDDSEDA